VCLIVLGIDQHPDYPLIFAANRDEFHSRPTREANWWPDKPDVLGGRDLQAGGTWLAVSRVGRFATVTNFRDAKPPDSSYRSRGHLVTAFLESGLTPPEYVATIDEDAYAGFNLIVGAGGEFAYLSNCEDGTRDLGPGIYGLSNALLDGPWHKVERSKAGLAALIDANQVSESALLRLMNDRDKGPVEEVERGRLDFHTAHAITAPFIILPEYGTRCTTLVLVDRNGDWRLTERRFDPAGTIAGESRFSFTAR
jgi:uncharacterized protein with NRDE domain